MLTNKRKQIKMRIRAKVKGTASRPRLSVYKSNKYLYAQLIDDEKAKTLVSVKAVKAEAQKIGKEIAGLAAKKKIKEVVFDRGGYPYHGHVKAVAEGAREGGLKI